MVVNCSIHMEQKFYVKGVDKYLTVYDNKIVLKSRFVMSWLLFIFLLFCGVLPALIYLAVEAFTCGKEKSIFIKNIKSIEMTKPNFIRNGYMQFNLDDSTAHGNAENEFYFTKKRLPECEAVQAFLEEVISKQ